MSDLYVNKAIASVNGGSTNFVITGTTTGINITVPTGINSVWFSYEIEIHL